MRLINELARYWMLARPEPGDSRMVSIREDDLHLVPQRVREGIERSLHGQLVDDQYDPINNTRIIRIPKDVWLETLSNNILPVDPRDDEQYLPRLGQEILDVLQQIENLERKMKGVNTNILDLVD